MDCGVGVLLWVEHPHQQISQLDQTVHLDVVGDLRGVVVGQVEQNQPVEAAVLHRPVQHALAEHLVPLGYAEPVEQLTGPVFSPRAGHRPRRRRTTHASRGQVQVGERVERRGLAGPGRAGQRDHSVVAGQAKPAPCPLDYRRSLADQRIGKPAPRCPGGLIQTVDAVDDVPAPADQLLGALHEGCHARSPLCRADAATPGIFSVNRTSSTRREASLSRSTASGSMDSPSRTSRYRCRSLSISSVTRTRRSRCAASARRRTAWSPKTPSSSFWPTIALPPAIPASAPVTPAVWANTTTINATESPFTPKARNRAVDRLSAPSVRTSSSTPCCQSRTARSARARKSRDARPRSRPESSMRC